MEERLKNYLESLLQVPLTPLAESRFAESLWHHDDDSDDNSTNDDRNDSSLLRKIDGCGDVEISSTSTTPFQCVWCNIFCRPTSTTSYNYPPPRVHRCTACHAAVYCSLACEQQDRQHGRHMHRCLRLRRCQDSLNELGMEFSQESNGVMDVFDRSNRMVFFFCDEHRGLGSTGERYLSARVEMVHALIEESVARIGRASCCGPRHWNLLALELAMEHCLDMLHLDPVVNDGSVTVMIAHCLFVLERYQDLYDFVKYWNILPRKLREIDRRDSSMAFPNLDHAFSTALGPEAFLNTKKQDMFEDQSLLALRLPSRCNPEEDRYIQTFPGCSLSEVVNNLYLALAKLCVYEKIKSIRMVTQSCFSIESGLISSNIGSFVGISEDWVTVNPLIMLNQARELLAFADTSIPGILRAVIEARVSLPLTFDKVPMIDLLRITWESHAFPWIFLVSFVQNQEPYPVIPRNNMLQQALDRLYEEFITAEIDELEYSRARHHWEAVKHSEPVRRLLLEEMQHGQQLYNHPFSITRIFSVLRNESRHAVDNLDLLLGGDAIGIIAIGLVGDKLLAREHLEQVRDRPHILKFIDEHGIDIPRDRLGDNDVEEIIQRLREKGLDTPSNLKLLFGDDGWVAAMPPPI